MSEQRINIEQLALQRNEVVEQNKQIMQVIEETCRMVLELDIQVEELAEERIPKLATGVCNDRAKMARVQLGLNL